MSDYVNRIEVDLKAFRSNLRQICRHLVPGTRVMMIVKAEAYGHGMVRIAQESQKIRELVYLGVSTALEAFRLRQARIQTPILILGVVHPDQIREVIRQGITPSVSSLREAQSFDRIAAGLKRKAKIHIELDTGMGRLGVWCAEAIWLLYKIHELRHIDLEGVFTHFPSADEDDTRFSRFQIEVFEKAVQICEELFGNSIKYVHMANSMAAMTYRNSHFTLVRPGIMAYGINPTRKKLPVRLKPILSLKSRVSFIKKVEKGRSISYGRTYVARRPTRIATIPIGYSSGYPFRLSNRSWVLIRGKKYRVVGRVTMDHIMVDVGTTDTVRKWDQVTLIGKSGKNQLTAEDLAEMTQTIPYEILCGLSAGVPRIYKS